MHLSLVLWMVSRSSLQQSTQWHEDYSSQDYDKYEAKRQRIMDTNEEISVNQVSI